MNSVQKFLQPIANLFSRAELEDGPLTLVDRFRDNILVPPADRHNPRGERMATGRLEPDRSCPGRVGIGKPLLINVHDLRITRPPHTESTVVGRIQHWPRYPVAPHGLRCELNTRP